VIGDGAVPGGIVVKMVADSGLKEFATSLNFGEGCTGTSINRAERALRFAVLWRRMMQGTYNEKGDRWVERLLSVRETCRLRGRPTFPVLVHAVTCYFNGQHPNVSWI
jgi:hypothetical protein